MFNFFYYFTILLVFSEFSIIYWVFVDNEITSHEYFLNEFFMVILLNYYLNYNNDRIKLNIDLISKYFVLFLKTPSFFFNYVINMLKKIFVFLYYYKYRLLRNTLKIYFRKYFYRYFIIWRPLFKKTSYFGYYRSNRSKWIK